jgi:hypothetical protein
MACHERAAAQAGLVHFVAERHADTAGVEHLVEYLEQARLGFERLSITRSTSPSAATARRPSSIARVKIASARSRSRPASSTNAARTSVNV